MVERLCWRGEQETCERPYFINSLAPDAKHFAKAVREHWGIEKRLHWHLDVLFHEEANRIRQRNAPTIMTTIRHLCLGLFDADSSRGSPAKKHCKGGWDDNYHANLVFGKKF